ncbi:MAG: LON peptidase substrate-binding domain-containing protein [Beijerinckiaceae bacterium]|nr:LON peptidase substrate-binding domain-containing protein [Beijerinckiaceae bacterium]
MPFNSPYRSASDFPEVVPVFPLPGALLLPRGQMPLNIFEDRYVTMIDDALRGTRLIALIQPVPEQPSRMAAPELYSVGCLGRITQFAETGDGRYLITLTGIARFQIREEMPTVTPYRQFRIDVEPFLTDLEARAGEELVDREALIEALRKFSKANDVAIDWDGVKEAPNEALVNALSMMSPYGVKEKQALLEAPDLKSRADMLVAITEMEMARQFSDGETTVQ